jgi:hypothetical protein
LEAISLPRTITLFFFALAALAQMPPIPTRNFFQELCEKNPSALGCQNGQYNPQSVDWKNLFSVQPGALYSVRNTPARQMPTAPPPAAAPTQTYAFPVRLGAKSNPYRVFPANPALAFRVPLKTWKSVTGQALLSQLLAQAGPLAEWKSMLAMADELYFSLDTAKGAPRALIFATGHFHGDHWNRILESTEAPANANALLLGELSMLNAAEARLRSTAPHPLAARAAKLAQSGEFLLFANPKLLPPALAASHESLAQLFANTGLLQLALNLTGAPEANLEVQTKNPDAVLAWQSQLPSPELKSARAEKTATGVRFVLPLTPALLASLAPTPTTVAGAPQTAAPMQVVIHGAK